MCLVLTKSFLFWRKLSEVSRGLSFFLPANGSRIQFQSENLCWKKYWYCLGSFSARAGQESGEGSLAIQYRCPCIELICKKRSVSIYLFWDLSVICSLFSPYSTPSTPSCYKHPFYSAFSSVPSLLLRVRKQHGANTPLQGTQGGWETHGTGGKHLGWSEELSQWRNVCIKRAISHSSRPVQQQGQRFGFLQLFPKGKLFISSLWDLCLLSDCWRVH